MYSLIIVGCGATGSNLIALLAQYMTSEKKINELILIDGDNTEAKNCINQKFSTKDINKNKAKVLSNRYSKLGITIGYLDDFIESSEQLIKIIKGCKENNDVIVVGCVDNNLARSHMHYTFMDKKISKLIYIDTGNGDLIREGQAVVGVKYEKKILMPPVAEYFPEILKARLEVSNDEEEYKCSQVDEHPQNMAVNVMSATVVFAIITNIVTYNNLENNYINFNLNKISVK